MKQIVIDCGTGEQIIEEVEYVIMPVDIEQLRLSKIDEFNKLCEYKIINEFCSDCLGEIKRFDAELTDQQNIAGLVSVAMAMMNQIPIEEELRWKSSGEPICYVFTPQQIMKLGLDLHKHKTDCILKFEKLRVYLKATDRTVEEIQNATWEMILP